MPISCEDSVYLAKLAEQAEHYEEIVENMKRVGRLVRSSPLRIKIFFLLLTRTLLVPTLLISSIEQKKKLKGNEGSSFYDQRLPGEDRLKYVSTFLMFSTNTYPFCCIREIQGLLPQDDGRIPSIPRWIHLILSFTSVTAFIHPPLTVLPSPLHLSHLLDRLPLIPHWFHLILSFTFVTAFIHLPLTLLTLPSIRHTSLTDYHWYLTKFAWSCFWFS